MHHAAPTAIKGILESREGKASGFGQVLDLTEAASRGLLESLRAGGPRSRGP